MREKVKVLLDGFRGPSFPRMVDEINEILERIAREAGTDFERPLPIKLEELVEMATKIAKKIPDCTFEKIEESPTTQDDHVWFCAFRFTTPLGKIAILIPWVHWVKGKGLQVERSVAVYADGEFRRGPQSQGEFEGSCRGIVEAIKGELLELEQKLST